MISRASIDRTRLLRTSRLSLAKIAALAEVSYDRVRLSPYKLSEAEWGRITDVLADAEAQYQRMTAEAQYQPQGKGSHRG